LKLTNTLAYFVGILAMKKKELIPLTPDVNVVKKFLSME
jgi:hypothetical protein